MQTVTDVHLPTGIWFNSSQTDYALSHTAFLGLNPNLVLLAGVEEADLEVHMRNLY
jgi:hypothetical protein